jgi:hypothetical protein
MTDWIVAVVTPGLFLVTTWYAYLTFRLARASESTVRHMREVRDEELAPRIVVCFEIPPGTELIYLVIRNLGRSIAENVRLRFDPPLTDSRGSDPGQLPMIGDGIHALPPGGELRHLLDGVIGYFGSQLPMRYRVEVCYRGGPIRTGRTEEQTLDLSSFKNLNYIREPRLADVVEPLESLARHHSRLVTDIRSIEKRLGNLIALRHANPRSDAPPADADSKTVENG